MSVELLKSNKLSKIAVATLKFIKDRWMQSITNAKSQSSIKGFYPFNIISSMQILKFKIQEQFRAHLHGKVGEI